MAALTQTQELLVSILPTMQALSEYNKNHDSRGRFSSGPGAIGTPQPTKWYDEHFGKGLSNRKRFDESEYSLDETRAIAAYQGAAYYSINSKLRKGNSLGEHQKYVDDLDSAMKRHKLSQDVIVHRGLDGSGTKLLTSKIFKDAGFSSSAVHVAKGEEAKFGDAIMKILVPKGMNAIWLGGGERELLLPRGLTFTRQADGVYRAAAS